MREPEALRLDVLVSPSEFTGARPHVGVVVIDQLRATTVVARALGAGAVRVVPAASPDEAIRLRNEVHPDALLCGERGGVKIDGFDLGNSPLEYTPEAVGGRTVILASTNGTVLLTRSAGARRVLTASLNNARAVAREIRRDGGVWAILPAGELGRACLEDLLCAGRVASLVMDSGPGVSVTDGVAIARSLYETAGSDTAGALLRCSHGRYLADIGFAADLPVCAEQDVLDVVPELVDGALVVPGPAAG